MSFAGTILDLDGTVYRSGNRRDRFGVTNRRDALIELLEEPFITARRVSSTRTNMLGKI